jgi:hypothetical protein
MSVFNANISTRIIDPVFDSENFRTEWRLNSNTVYLSNMRLINVGIEDDGNSETGLNPLTGAYCIESIQLYDGNQLLDQVLQASIYRAFQNANNTNDLNMSVENVLSRNSYGFIASGIQDWTGTEPNREDIKISGLWEGTFETGSNEPNSAWISLKEVLPFLTSSLYVPTSVFKNLRLVIQWKSKAQLKNLIVERTVNVNTLSLSSLVVDEVVDGDGREKVMKNYQGVVFKAVEHDAVHCEAINPAADSKETQNNRFLVNGFNNKTVERLIVVQTPLTESTWVDGTETKGAGNQGSVAQLNNAFQFRVNGANKLPRSGFTKKNQRLAALTDSYGEFTIIPTSNFVYVPYMKDLVSADNQTQNLLGQIDYTACDIREPVRELIIEYNRDGVAGAGNAEINQPVRLNLFGECTKSIRVDNGKYIISYL